MRKKIKEQNKQTKHKQASKKKTRKKTKKQKTIQNKAKQNKKERKEKHKRKNPHTISLQLQYEEAYLSRSSDLQSCDCARQLEDTKITVTTLTAWRYLFHSFNNLKYKT